MMHAKQDRVDLSVNIFDELAGLAQKESGLMFAPEKRSLVQSRLRHRLRATGISDFATYSRHVLSPEGSGERRLMISALTTNVTHFFRESHHFDLMSEWLGDQISEKVRLGLPIRIWSAGCSKGHEPYSIAMHMLEKHPELKDADFRILATDIDPKVLKYGYEGNYRGDEAKHVPLSAQKLFMTPCATSPGDIRIVDQLRQFVTFKELNLIADWPMKKPFDAIFCRNVVIYFDLATQDSLWPRFVQSMTPDGILFLGHSERVSEPRKFGLRTVGPTAFARAIDTHNKF